MRERRMRRVVARAIPRIVEALGPHGVSGVQWFRAYDGEPVIWLVTATDADRERVAQRGFFSDDVSRLLVEAGLDHDLARRAGVTVESEETVQRDFGGNWWHAMK